MAGTSAEGTTACPHCGGVIKLAAKLCKHCKRAVQSNLSSAPQQVSVGEGPVASVQVTRRGVASTLSVLASLRAFVAKRAFIDLQAVDDVLATRQSYDAAAVLRQLSTTGHITQVQAESLVAEFHQAQMTHAHAVLSSATTLGLVPVSHVEAALASYAPLAFTVTIHDHLVATGLLTRTQADTLESKRPPQRSSTNATGAFWAPAAALLILFAILLSKSWWTSRDFSAGLLDAEICTEGHCQTKSYADLLSDFEDQGTADLLPAEFRAHVRDSKIAFVVGLLLVAAAASALILRYRHSAYTKGATTAVLIGCAAFVQAVIKALISGHAANNHDTSISFAPIVALLATAFIGRTALQIRKAA